MKRYILITMLSGSAAFWAVFLVFLFDSRRAAKKRPVFPNEQKPDKADILCLILNFIGAFLLFELLSFCIALFVKSIPLNVILHFPAWFLALLCGHRFLPRAVNPLIERLFPPDKKP